MSSIVGGQEEVTAVGDLRRSPEIYRGNNMTVGNHHSQDLQVSRANVIFSMTNWVFIILALLLVGIRTERFAIGLVIAVTIISAEFIRIFRILWGVRNVAQNNDIILYFRGDAARKWYSVRDARAGIVSFLDSETMLGEQDGPSKNDSRLGDS